MCPNAVRQTRRPSAPRRPVEKTALNPPATPSGQFPNPPAGSQSFTRLAADISLPPITRSATPHLGSKITKARTAVWSVRGVYTVLWYLYYFITRGGSVSTPYFHLAERDQPFVVQQHVPLGKQFLIAVMVGLLIWLFTRFALGRPSRRYYGFDDVERA